MWTAKGEGGFWKNHVGPQGGEGVLEAGPHGQFVLHTTAQNALLLRDLKSYNVIFYEKNMQPHIMT